MSERTRRPDFFIVGAARAGTTSLWRYLTEHPEVFMPQGFLRKEPSYFSDIFGMTDRKRYLNLFTKASDDHARIGEASTAYLTDPAAASRIAEAIPDARIVIMLRNPADRAYSLYNWMTQEGYEFAPSFKNALSREERRAASPPAWWMDGYYYNYLYVRSGLYYEQVERYLDHFSTQRVGVWLFEDFVQDTDTVYREICKFLKVSDRVTPTFERHNASRSAISPPLQLVLRKLNDMITRIRRGIGFEPRNKMDRDFLLRLGTRAQKPPPLAPGLRRRLLTIYRDEVERLEELLGRDLSQWSDD